MSGDAKPKVRAQVTFLSPSEGGRSGIAYNTAQYMPHLVVGDPSQRAPITAQDGRTLVEEYLGVGFTGAGDEMEPGRPYVVELSLLYSPQVNYDALVPGATFTIREGGRIVGFGSVTQ